MSWTEYQAVVHALDRGRYMLAQIMELLRIYKEHEYMYRVQ